MQCPTCGHQPVYKHGYSAAGRQTYLCPACRQTFSRRRRPRFHLSPWLGGLGILLLSPFLLDWSVIGLLQLLPDDPSTAVDAIVVLGRGPAMRGNRTLKAAELWHQGRASTLFISGMSDSVEMLDLLSQMEIPPQRLMGERCSQSTWENALFSDLVLEPQQIDRILLVTDPAHMARAYLVFERFGFEVFPHPSHQFETPISLTRSWLIVREYIALAKYALAGQLWPQPQPQEAQLVAQADAQLQDWQCDLVGSQ